MRDSSLIYMSGYAEGLPQRRSRQTQRFCKSHFDLHLWPNSLNSSRPRAETFGGLRRKYAPNCCIAHSGDNARVGL